MSEELKPCPLCGEKGKRVNQNDTNLKTIYKIQCSKCQHGTNYSHEGQPERDWNERRVLDYTELECCKEHIKLQDKRIVELEERIKLQSWVYNLPTDAHWSDNAPKKLWRKKMKDMEAENIKLKNTIIGMSEPKETHIISLDKWQPIETAPKDGTKFIIPYSEEVAICWWGKDPNMEEGEEWLCGDGDDFSCGYYYIPVKPTHWKPMPEFKGD